MPCAQERRHQVRGVAGQQCAPDAPARRDLRGELVGDDADQLEIVRRTAFGTREPAPDVFRTHRFLVWLARKDHERPAPVLRAHLHRHAGLLRLAELAQIGQVRPRLLRPGVDHQPILVEAEEFVLDAECATHETVAPVAADEKAPALGAHAVLVLDRERDAVCILRDADGLVALEHAHGRKALRHTVELGLERRLVDRDEFRPAMRGARLHVVRKQDAALVGELVGRQEERRGRDRRADADLLEHAQHVVMHDADARQVVELGVALEHRDAMAGAAEQHRGEHSGRPVADDHHVMHVPLPASGSGAHDKAWSRKMPAPRSMRGRYRFRKDHAANTGESGMTIRSGHPAPVAPFRGSQDPPVRSHAHFEIEGAPAIL
jgi:hypothetical protein